ncbi:hypothetical protein BH09MYX1_BH09MYX1_31840 [soil metagenome]
MRPRILVFALALALPFAATIDTPSEACGAAYPAGSYVQLSGEQTIIVWDAATKTEHFIRKPTFDGDPKSFGFFVPTPTVPTIKKEDDAIFTRVRTLLEAPRAPGGGGDAVKGGMVGATAGGHVDVMQTLVIDGYQVVTLAATDENALGEWLAKNRYVDKPALRRWAKTYTDKKWLITAMRYEGTNDDGKRGAMATPTLRLSFPIDAPFYPYTEAATDDADREAFLKRSGPVACSPDDPLCLDRGADYVPPRPLDVWVVAQTSMQGNIGTTTGGPPVLDSALVTAAAVAAALGDTKEWSFDPNAHDTWVVTHLAENVQTRNAADDIVFGSYDLPKPRLGPSLAPPMPEDPVYDPDSLFHVEKPHSAGVSHKTKMHRVALAILALFVAFAAAFGIWSQREKRLS